MSSEHPDDAVVVATYPNEYEADLAVSWLEAEGVASVVIADDAGGAYPMLQIARGVKVLVAPENATQAREILAGAADPSADSADPDDGAAGSPPAGTGK